MQGHCPAWVELKEQLVDLWRDLCIPADESTLFEREFCVHDTPVRFKP